MTSSAPVARNRRSRRRHGEACSVGRGGNLINSRYVWLSIQFAGDRVVIDLMDEWDLSFFDGNKKRDTAREKK